MDKKSDDMEKSTYLKFAVMLAISFFMMYGVMFLNVDSLDHIYLSATRTYMTLLMICPMACVMLLLMKKMYNSARLNGLIVGLSVAVFIIALTFLRKQVLISDKQYMNAMIPHHSSAILTSKHAYITDPELKKLTLDIIDAQEREIAQMKQILARIK